MRTETEFYISEERLREVYGRYLVGSDGKVYTVKDGERFEMSLFRGGRYVNLRVDGKTLKVKVCYLVARAFVPNGEMRPYVVHLNGDGGDNRAENLAWSEEEERIARPGRKARIRVCSVDSSGRVEEYGSVREASEASGSDRRGIMACARGKLKTCGGRRWRLLKV